MTTRFKFNPMKVPEVFQAMVGLNAGFMNSTLEHSLIELVKMRASQINGCGYCLDMHTKDARLEGETEQRIYLLSVWKEAPLYTERERAALAWTEVLTNLDQPHVSDEIHEMVTAQFTEEELMRLTLLVNTINGWNRFAIAFNAVPGSYKPGSFKASLAAVKN